MAGNLVLERADDWFGRLRRMKVLVDGQQLAALRPGDRELVALPAGPHTAYARMDWARSSTVSFELVDDGEIRLVVSASFFSALLTTFLRPHRAFTLRLVS